MKYDGADVNGRKKLSPIFVLFLENGGKIKVFSAVFGKTVEYFFCHFPEQQWKKYIFFRSHLHHRNESSSGLI